MNHFKNLRVFFLSIAGILFSIVVAGESSAYVLLSSHWTPPTNHWNLGGFNAANQTAFIEAMNKWNGDSNFSFTSANPNVSPCDSVAAPDGQSGVRFDANDCGRGFGATTLAVTWTWRSGSSTTDTDMVFNTAYTWGIHDQATGSTSVIDFRRVSVHELGHALGLGHEIVNAAIMQPIYGDVLGPLPDDINGMVAIYGAPPTSVPGVPSSISASDGTSTSYVATNWSSSSGATSYELYRCTSSSTNSCGGAIYTNSSTHYNDSAATAGTTYYYRVKACNSAGCSAYSSYDMGFRAVSTGDTPEDFLLMVMPPILAATQGGTPTPPPVLNPQWGAYNEICCTTSSTTYGVTQGGQSRSSRLSSCNGTPTFSGYLGTSAGSKFFSHRLTSSTCGTLGADGSHTLQPGKRYLWVAEYNSGNPRFALYSQNISSVRANGLANGLSSDTPADRVSADMVIEASGPLLLQQDGDGQSSFQSLVRPHALP